MSNYYIISVKLGVLKFIAVIPCLFFFTNSIFAQNNTSYNLNSIPINGGNCTAFGWQALSHDTFGNDNTANGYRALYSNTTGSENTASGVQALYSNTTGGWNTATGTYALYSNTTGNDNAAHGYSALGGNSTGSSNTANGFWALANNTTSSNNTANGYRALYSNTTGNYNTALGDSAGFHSLGSSNVFIGRLAGGNETGSNKMYIGNDAAKTLLYGDFSSGQILLGKPNATGYVFRGTRTLNVIGGILADSMRLAPSSNWADKVFNKDYPLKPLQELEQYISTNKHLPGIPSASEVKANGVNVGDMETKLLEKIEELHLYILQQQKQIGLQQKNYDQQQKQIDELKREIKHSR